MNSMIYPYVFVRYLCVCPLLQEILLAIKLVKFYNWQDSFAEQVSAVRNQEGKGLPGQGPLQ
jgi:hypothetical protein